MDSFAQGGNFPIFHKAKRSRGCDKLFTPYRLYVLELDWRCETKNVIKKL